MNWEDVYLLLAIAISICITCKVLIQYVYPFMLRIGTTDIEKNPKWITSELKGTYYGFHDIDFILVESKFGHIPRFRVSKDRKKLEFLVDKDTPTRDVDILGQLALSEKIRINYGVYYPDKSIEWLSILCYLLDGGEINQNNVKWEERQ